MNPVTVAEAHRETDDYFGPWVASTLIIGLLLAICVPMAGRESVLELVFGDSASNLTIWAAFVLPFVVAGSCFRFALSFGRLDAVDSGRRFPLWLLALPSILIWGFYLLVCWPGFLSSDSLDQWEQIVTGYFRDDHPAANTLLMWLITRIGPYPALVVFAQQLGMAVACALVLRDLQVLGVRRVVVIALALAVALTPTNGIMSTTIWKDVPFTIAILILTHYLLREAAARGAWLKGTGHAARFGLTCGLVHLLRHNGFLITFPAVIGLVVLYPRKWRTHLTGVAVYAGTVIVTKWLMFSVIGVVRSETPFLPTMALHALSAHLSAGDEFSKTELEQIGRVRPVDRWTYHCSSMGDNLYDGLTDWNVMKLRGNEYVTLAGKKAMQSPEVFAKHVLCTSSFLWRVLPYTGIGRVETLFVTFDDSGQLEPVFVKGKGYKIDFDMAPLFDTAWFKDFLGAAFGSTKELFLVRPAIWFHVLLVVSIFAAFRSRNPHYLFVFLPVLLNSLFISFVAIQQVFRYLYPVFLLGILSIGLFFLPNGNSRKSR